MDRNPIEGHGEWPDAAAPPKTAVQKYIVKAAGIKTLCTAKKDYASDSIARQMISIVSSFE